MKLALVHALLLSSTTLFAKAGKPKPSEDDYVEKRMQDCIMFREGTEETCDRDLRKQFRKAPYLEPAEFVRRLMKLKDLNKKISTVTPERLADLVWKIRALPISLTEEMNGCDGRAETVSYVLATREKINVLNISLAGHLEIESKYVPLDHAPISWGHHVAPAILVKEAGGRVVPYSLDLTLLDEPRPLSEWLEKVTARSETLVEIYALPKTETTPAEPGETPPAEFTDAQVSLIEARLQGPRAEGLTRLSPLRPDLAPAFVSAIRTSPIRIETPFEENYEYPSGESMLAKSFGTSKIQELEKEAASSLRCQATSEGASICGFFFWTRAPSQYCEINLGLPRGAKDFVVKAETARVRCYRFSNGND